MKRARGGIVAGLAVLLALAGCATAQHRPGDGPQVLIHGTDPDVVREAGIEGVVDLRNGCFVVAVDGDTWLIHWPQGTELGEDHRSLKVPGADLVSVGDEISASGGYDESVRGCGIDDLAGSFYVDLVVDVGHTR